jgi:tetratricopeptide (TPR) repeat protein
VPLILGLSVSISYAKSVVPPDDPSQSIVYWKPHTISASKDPLVAEAQSVFSVLLRAWDSARIEPVLYIVDSTAGPWAASLSDGNILMSRDAIVTVKKFGAQRSKHLLAFILAHELAHQRSDDLWHQRFFRLVGTQNAKTKNKILNKLNINKHYLENVAEKEIQADHDSLLMMNSVGYDPYQVLDKINRGDFFTKWVENIWKDSCKLQSGTSKIANLCDQAKSRALRARLQLTNVATQSMLYDLGVQSFAANDFINARRYFTAYGRDNTNRVILSAIGQSYFAEALSMKKNLFKQYSLKQPDFYYPILLDASSDVLSSLLNKEQNTTRSSTESIVNKIKKKIHLKVERSIEYYEKAIRLEPTYANTYLLLAYSYLLDGNSYMVRGVIQGKYLPKFGNDSAAEMILAMTNSIEGNQSKARIKFDKLIKTVKSNRLQVKSLSPDLVLYSVYHNSSALYDFVGEPDKAKQQWQELAKISKKSGNSMLFQMALSQLKPSLALNQLNSEIQTAPTINGMRLKDKFSAKKLSRQPHKINDLWLEGELHHVYRFDDGSRYIIGPDQKIMSAWQDYGELYLSGSKNSQIAGNVTADRPLKKFGIPDRRLHLMSGDYLAYDKYGMAIHIVENKVAGWFLY